MVKAKKWTLVKHFDGLPKRSDFKIVEFEPPPLEDKKVLLKALYLSLDPYMRPFSKQLPLGSTMIGEQVARVVESKNSSFPVGMNVVCNCGWVTHFVSDGSDLRKMPPYPEGVPLSLGLGMLGMPGMTANYGFLELCDPKPGEIVVVSGAAGAVGSVVGQMAKMQGCRVVGFAGTDEKVGWLKELGYDEAFNYKKVDLDATLKSVAPDGINCYFDNVGGDFSNTVIANLGMFGRMSCCGSVSSYNATEPRTMPELYWTLVVKEIKIQGFLIYNHMDRWPEWTQRNIKWIKEGKLKYREHITEGFDNMFKAFSDLFTGANFGKAVVKV